MCPSPHLAISDSPPPFYVFLLLPKPSSCGLTLDIMVPYKDFGFLLRRNWYFALLGSEHGCAGVSPAVGSRGPLCSCPGLCCPGSAPSLGGQGPWTFGEISTWDVGFSCPHLFSGISSLTSWLLLLLLPQLYFLSLNGLVWPDNLIRPEKLVSYITCHSWCFSGCLSLFRKLWQFYVFNMIVLKMFLCLIY